MSSTPSSSPASCSGRFCNASNIIVYYFKYFWLLVQLFLAVTSNIFGGIFFKYFWQHLQIFLAASSNIFGFYFRYFCCRMPDVNADHRRSSTNSALGYSFLVVPLLVFLVLLTNKLDETVRISFFAATSPLFLTFFTLIITSFGTRGNHQECPFQSSMLNSSIAGGNQYWFGLRKPPCQFLFSVCPCLQLFGKNKNSRPIYL